MKKFFINIATGTAVIGAACAAGAVAIGFASIFPKAALAVVFIFIAWAIGSVWRRG